MLIEGTFIYWPEQCKYCSKSWTTEHCSRNQSFMRKLNGMYQEYLGSLEFKCDYFTPDLDKIREKQQSECCCDEQKCEQKGEQKRIKININQIKI